MKSIFKQNAGLTLIELVVAMAIATVVTAAATSVLFFGLRINRQTGDTASQQITVSALLNTVEGIISDGNISEIEMNTESWCIRDKENKPLLSYYYDPDEKKGAVYVGDYSAVDLETGEITATPILTDLLSSYVEMYDGLFTIYVETKEGMFSSSVLCRSLATGTGEHDDQITPGTSDENRLKFLNVLKSQYRSRGEIIGAASTDPFQYFSEWYIGRDYDDGVYDDGWNAKTPWCACYISWAMAHGNVKNFLKSPPAENTNWFANVDEFKSYFQQSGFADQGQRWFVRGEEVPTAGDLIFFDWTQGTNPQHVGVVLKVEGNMVYTIEGNSSGRVTVRSYSINDPRIIGYGVLPWT